MVHMCNVLIKTLLFDYTQKCIASNETSGIDIVVQIILLTELTALEEHQDEAMKLKSSAIKTLLAVMESHQDSDIIDRILVKIGSPDQLVGIHVLQKKKNTYDGEILYYNSLYIYYDNSRLSL